MIASSDNVYEIEKIVDSSISTDGEVIYLIKWKYYDSDQNTWEPEENVSSQSIKLFNAKKRLKEKKSSKTKRKTLSLTRRKNMTTSPVVIDYGTNGGGNRAKRNNNLTSSPVVSEYKNYDDKSFCDAQIQTSSPFYNGKALEKIIGALNSESGLDFLVKWVDNDDYELLASSVVKDLWPSDAVDFILERITWVENENPVLL